jgi:hypothetical protein
VWASLSTGIRLFPDRSLSGDLRLGCHRHAVRNLRILALIQRVLPDCAWLLAKTSLPGKCAGPSGVENGMLHIRTGLVHVGLNLTSALVENMTVTYIKSCLTTVLYCHYRLSGTHTWCCGHAVY